MTVSVFISYSSKDRKLAREICEAIEKQGFACWIADRDVRPGENFQEAIVRAIRAARVMLLVFTANANDSNEVKKELALASQRKLAVIPIRVDAVEPSDAFAYEFATRQWIDLSEGWDHGIQRLTQSLESTVGAPVPLNTLDPPPPPPEPPPPVPKARPTLQEGRPARLAGIGGMLVGMFLFSLSAAFAKYLVTIYPIGQFLSLSSGAALFLLLPFIWKQRAAFVALERPWLQLLRAALSTISFASLLFTTRYLGLADVAIYYAACPIIVALLSAAVLREQVDWRYWTVVLIVFGGALLALTPTPHAIGLPGLIALVGSISFAIVMLITHSVRSTSDTVLASAQLIGTGVLGALLAPLDWTTPSLNSLGLFALAGVISLGSLICINRSLKFAPASALVPYQYSMAVWIAISSVVLLGENLDLASVGVGTIIIVAGLYFFRRVPKPLRRDHGADVA